jgi:hypothetical protein
MSGGWAVKTKKRGVVRAGAQRLPGPRFLPVGLGLDGLGAAGPRFKQKDGAWAGAQRRPFASPETG